MENRKNERFIRVEDNIDLWVETYGECENEACLFISGAGANASFWSENLCKRLVKKGCYVIKYDHRDFGYSTKVEYDKYPFDVMQLTWDAVSILDSLKIEKVHAVGHSMGGFIVQLLAIHFPGRIVSMTSISSSTNSPIVLPPPEETWKIFLENTPKNDFENDLEGFLPVWRYLNGTAVFDQDMAIEYTRNLYARQEITGALGESHAKAQENLSDRSDQLKKVKIPALIIHGEEDYLVDKSGGIQTAECIENSILILVPQMGHIPFNREILMRVENEIVSFFVLN
jgi:pimeloyl-ACP methyl ester carboxylesterase